MAGYSARSLPDKLGLYAAVEACILHAPDNYILLLEHQYSRLDTRFVQSQYDWIQAFYSERSSLVEDFAKLKDHIKLSGQLWISWPKRVSKVLTDLDENKIRAIGLDAGLVDVKVVAVDDIWSSLKFVYRLEDR